MKVKTRNDPTVTTLWVATVVVLVSTLIFAIWPKPSNQDLINNIAKQKSQLTSEIIATNRTITATQVDQKQHDWVQLPALIAPQALSLISVLAAKNGVSISDFRPQKNQLTGGLTMLPFAATVQGPFPLIAKFAHDLNQNPKLSIESVQVSAGGNGSDICQANVTIIAFTSLSDLGVKNG